MEDHRGLCIPERIDCWSGGPQRPPNQSPTLEMALSFSMESFEHYVEFEVKLLSLPFLAAEWLTTEFGVRGS